MQLPPHGKTHEVRNRVLLHPSTQLVTGEWGRRGRRCPESILLHLHSTPKVTGVLGHPVTSVPIPPPEEHMYLKLSKFLLSHQHLNMSKVPGFYQFFFNSDFEVCVVVQQRLRDPSLPTCSLPGASFVYCPCRGLSLALIFHVFGAPPGYVFNQFFWKDDWGVGGCTSHTDRRFE